MKCVFYEVRAEATEGVDYVGDVKHLHRDPASRKGRRKRKSQISKYGRESLGTRTQERLRWPEPATYTKDSPALSLESAARENHTVTVRQ
jgi:hypothetical protein